MADVRSLPAPVTSIWEWQMQGACRDLDSSMFFHPERERGPSRAQRERRAQQICAGCPVREQCRAHALSVHEPYGVWGGLTESERVAIHRSTIRPVEARDGEHRNGDVIGADSTRARSGAITSAGVTSIR